VRETISKGSNLFVTYPGYSDYRHIPVIGKGVTFQLRGSPDSWGMMCEGDLEEVYRRRSVNVSLMMGFTIAAAIPVGLSGLLQQFTEFSATAVTAIALFALFCTGSLFRILGTRKLASRLSDMTEVIRTIAEGEGNLKQRLDDRRLRADETGEMGRWMNSFIDNLDSTMGQVIAASNEVNRSKDFMVKTNEETLHASHYLEQTVVSMLNTLEQQIEEISHATQTAEQLKLAMDKVVEEAQARLATVKAGTQDIRDVVRTSAQSVKSLDEKTSEIVNIISVISDITNQTNLLALNAAIEAARAGEQGRGFSVVADEVRSLAARTAGAAEEIQTMLGGIQKATQEAVNFMEKGAENVDMSLKMTEETGAENKTLYELVDQMVEAIQLLNITNTSNADTAQKMGTATEQMNHSISALRRRTLGVGLSARKLNTLVGSFEVSSR
jgi:methyl-accepting chemotaxis protein